jgi:peptidylprolyl isomerase
LEHIRHHSKWLSLRENTCGACPVMGLPVLLQVALIQIACYNFGMRLLICIFAVCTIQALAQPKIPANIPPAEGKITTQYAMRYIDVAPGDGKPAESGKLYVVHYTGWLYDGTQFDSSRGKEPLSFEQGKRKVIAGWDSGFEGMRVGGKRRLLIPYQLAYGEKGRGKIPPKADLIFDIELIDVKEPPPPDPAAKQ